MPVQEPSVSSGESESEERVSSVEDAQDSKNRIFIYGSIVSSGFLAFFSFLYFILPQYMKKQLPFESNLAKDIFYKCNIVSLGFLITGILIIVMIALDYLKYSCNDMFKVITGLCIAYFIGRDVFSLMTMTTPHNCQLLWETGLTNGTTNEEFEQWRLKNKGTSLFSAKFKSCSVLSYTSSLVIFIVFNIFIFYSYFCN